MTYRRGSNVAQQNVEAFVENAIKHAAQQLTRKLEEMHIASLRNAEAVIRRSSVAAWLNSLFDTLPLPDVPSEEELRRCLRDGSVLCHVMNKIDPGAIPNIILFKLSEGATFSDQERFDNVTNFLVAIDGLRLPIFKPYDLEKGSMVTVVDCLLSLREYHVMGNHQNLCYMSADESPGMNAKGTGESPLKGMNGKGTAESPLNRSLDEVFDVESLLSDSSVSSPAMSYSSWMQIGHSTWMQIGQAFQEFIRVKAMTYPDIKAIERSELLKCIDKTPPKPLLSLVRAILGDKQNEELHCVVDFLLKKVIEKFELCLLSQQQHIKELKHILRDETETMERNYQENVQQLQSDKREVELELQKKIEDIQVRQIKERVQSEASICALKDELETMKKANKEELETMRMTDQEHVLQLQLAKEVELELQKKIEEAQNKQIKERVESEAVIRALKHELETLKKINQEQVQQLQSENREVYLELQKRKDEIEILLSQQKGKNNEIDENSSKELTNLRLRYSCILKLLGVHVAALEDIREVSQLTNEEISMLEKQLNGLANTAANYAKVVAENRQLHNEIQDLKGNIRVYCRVRPFLPGDCVKQTTIEYTGEEGELLIANPKRSGKETFKFNKVLAPSASQEEVYRDIQPLVSSVLDGYNVCIFAYGQTGSGKTYTMSGPNTLSSKEDWGVNYRALNDIFQISQTRRESFRYEIWVQMIEIYNEQVRDLLIDCASPKTSRRKSLEIRSTSQSTGLSVPDAIISHVESTQDVLDLMKIGKRNRAVGATALNENSSRSHSILSVHLQGTDLSSGVTLRGCLHLIDLAGSERIDKSEVTGDRLKEAMHINKSLSALGDVIFALANKSTHVPYRNSKLTQILQDSLGAHAKTLMFVHINPDIDSHSETISTLKFATRVSSLELGAARSNKESKEVRDLKEQVSKLKEIIARKDTELKGLQKLKP